MAYPCSFTLLSLAASSRLEHLFFFLTDPATTEIYTLSLHDALPISGQLGRRAGGGGPGERLRSRAALAGDRKGTRLNSSHRTISYAVFCLQKKKSRICLLCCKQSSSGGWLGYSARGVW